MYGWILLVSLVALCSAHTLRFKPTTFPDFGLLSDGEIDYVNSLDTTWKAGRNFHPSQAEGVIRRLGARIEPEELRLPEKEPQAPIWLPDSYDPRNAYPDCESLFDIRDQGNCGSDWACAPAAVMSDRTCIANQGRFKLHYSTLDLLACCYFCINSTDPIGAGCQGGYPSMSWLQWLKKGIVSGNGYNSLKGCLPYPIPPCDHYEDGSLPDCQPPFTRAPTCDMECQPGYKVTYDQDLHVGSQAYHLSSEAAYMADLYQLGPIQVVFQVYTDFLTYKSGVYQHVSGNPMGQLAVKILGWGTENGTKYWLVANSWNTEWGDNGYFKILRGSNECEIEQHGYAGTV